MRIIEIRNEKVFFDVRLKFNWMNRGLLHLRLQVRILSGVPDYCKSHWKHYFMLGYGLIRPQNIYSVRIGMYQIAQHP